MLPQAKVRKASPRGQEPKLKPEPKPKKSGSCAERDIKKKEARNDEKKKVPFYERSAAAHVLQQWWRQRVRASSE